MSILTSSARRLWLLGITLAVSGAGVSAGVSSEQAASAPSMEWTGSVTVDIRGSATMPQKVDGHSISYIGRETTTYTLRGDGTASWASSAAITTDLSFYKVPMTGGGAGHGTSSVTFNGTNWDINVDAEGDYPTVTDYTAQDRVWADVGPARIAVEIAKALGQPIHIGPHIEKGRSSPAGGGVAARGAGNAATLSGSVTTQVEANHIGGFNGTPATQTITWNLARTPVPPRVRIYGDECGCIEPDDTDKTLHFIAGASPQGGTFSEFVVTSSGKMPDIVSNNGGEQPSLDITGTKDTGTVTLKIRYTRNGVSRDSDPFTVDFCALEKIELADGEDLSFAGERLTVKAKAKAWQGGQDVSDKLEWDIEKMGSPTSLEAVPSTKKGDHIEFRYNGLPERNSEFGPKTLRAKTSGKCNCQREETVRTFFDPLDRSHPGGDAAPNWFHYWKQTSGVPAAMRGIIKFRESVEDPRMPGESAALYDPETATVYLSKLIATADGCQPRRSKTTFLQNGEHAQGIDCFAEDVRHELQHRQDAIDWWGSPKGIASMNVLEWLAKDWDADQVPNVIEDAHPRCDKGSLMPDLGTGLRATWFTCSERPFSKASDAEINAYWTGWAWPIGSIDAEDWSCGKLAKQWKGKKCGG